MKFLFVLCAFLFMSNLQAHTNSRSYSTWEIQKNKIKLRIFLPASLRRKTDFFLRSDIEKESLLKHSIGIKVNGNKPKLLKLKFVVLKNKALLVKIDYGFTEVLEKFVINYSFLFENLPSHLNYSKIIWSKRAVNSELLFNIEHQSFHFSLKKNPSTANSTISEKLNSVDWLVMGIWHILGGYDHLFFLVGLISITFNKKYILYSISGFSIGHSLSLVAASVGFISPLSYMVEAFIGLSIFLAALSALRFSKPYSFSLVITNIILPIFLLSGLSFISISSENLAWVCIASLLLLVSVTSLHKDLYLLLIFSSGFGLIHGFGFAGTFLENFTLQKVPLLSLFSFNIGIEIGQLTVIFLILLCVNQLKKVLYKKKLLLMHKVVNSFLLVVGIVLFWQRISEIDILYWKWYLNVLFLKF